jgi:ATP-binding cassette subfamily C protein CydD
MAREPSVAGRILAVDRRAGTLLYLAVSSGAVAGGLFAVQAVLLSWVVDGVFLRGQFLPDVLPLLGAMLALLLVRSGLIWGGDAVAQRAASRVKGSLRRQLTAHFFALGPAYTRGERSGELVNTTVQGVEALDDYITQFLPARALAAVVPAFVFLLVLLLDPPTTLVLLFGGPMLLLMLAFIGGRAKAITERRFRELSWMSAFFLDVLQGIATLKMFGRSREQAGNVEAIGRHYGNTTMEVLATAFQTSLVMEWAATAATALVALEVSFRLMDGTLPFNRALAVLVLTPEFFLPLRTMAMRYHAGTAGKAAAERIFAILDTPLPAPAAAPSRNGPSPRPATQSTNLPIYHPPPLRPYDIRFQDVHFAYPAGGSEGDQARPALRGLSLEVPQGQMVALVGPTGAGKSTVAGLLLRFLHQQAGRIEVGGRPLESLDPRAWRAQVAWVPQLPHLFHGSVAANIRLARPDASDEQVAAAARQAHAHQFIAALPGGYDTQIGERGARLSGGQQQRIAVARAFLKDAPFLILDEATAHLDAQSEALVLDALRRLLQGRTALVIAHRLALAYGADRIVVMAAGRAVDAGDHATLLARCTSYRDLVAAYEGTA